MSPELKDLLGKLLNREVKQRPTMEEIKNHAFFKTNGFASEDDWNNLKNKKLTPPFLPSDYLPKSPFLTNLELKEKELFINASAKQQEGKLQRFESFVKI